MKRIIIAVVAAIISSAAFADIVGRASVIDGDTIEIHGQRIRLHGIDAPEKGQPCFDATSKPYRCGQIAAMALDEFIGASPVQCRERDVDRYGRTVADCSVRGEDIELWLVRNGHAMAYPDIRAPILAPSRRRRTRSGEFGPVRSNRRGLAKGSQILTPKPPLARREALQSTLTQVQIIEDHFGRATRKTRNVSLTPELERSIEKGPPRPLLRRGEVICAALRLLEKEEKKSGPQSEHSLGS